MSPLSTPNADASVIGVSERDVNRDVATFFAAHPFGGDDESFEKLSTEAFFRRFLGAPDSSTSAHRPSPLSLDRLVHREDRGGIARQQ